VLAQREEIAFVQLVCDACQTQTLALVTGAPATEDDAAWLGEGALGHLLAGDRDDHPEASGRAREPISEADVLEMRAYLAEYQGDVRGLLDGPADKSEPGRGSDDETDAPG
jgi:hypothetical protein